MTHFILTGRQIKFRSSVVKTSSIGSQAVVRGGVGGFTRTLVKGSIWSGLSDGLAQGSFADRQRFKIMEASAQTVEWVGRSATRVGPLTVIRSSQLATPHLPS